MVLTVYLCLVRQLLRRLSVLVRGGVTAITAVASQVCASAPRRPPNVRSVVTRGALIIATDVQTV